MSKPPERPPIQLTCPQCSKTFFYSKENPYRPFCSERCKLIDFGDWVEEKHFIAGDPAGTPPSSD